MKEWDRRGFLKLTGWGLSSAYLTAGCAPVPAPTTSPASDDPAEPNDPSEDPADPTPPEVPEVILADEGPELPSRLPHTIVVSDDRELAISLDVVSGALPDDLEGHAFWIHAVPYEEGGSLFAGDGRMLRADFHPDRVDLTTRLARTPCWYADQATMGTSSEFRSQGVARMSNALGNRNMANTAFIPMGDRLLVVNDAGRPWEIDTESLDLITAVGDQSTWTGALPEFIDNLSGPTPFPTYMSTAHPARDPHDGTVFTVNYGMSVLGFGGFTRLISWNGHDEPTGWDLLTPRGRPLAIQQSVHQIAITAHWIILADTSFLVEVEEVFGIDGFRPVSPDTTLYLVDRRELTADNDRVRVKTVEVPREVVHFMADFEDDGDVLVLHVAHNTASDASEFLQDGDVRADTGQAIRDDLAGVPCAATDRGVLTRYEIDANRGRVLTTTDLHDEAFWGGPALVTWKGPDVPDKLGHVFWSSMGFHPELRLKRIEEAYAAHPHRVVDVADLATQPTPATLATVHAERMELVDVYEFPLGRIGFSPVFVPRVGSAHDRDGYIACTVMSDDEDTPGSTGDEIWLFDAANLAQGPLTRLAHRDLVLPLTLHTTWIPRLAPRDSDYQVDVRAELEPAVAELSQSLQRIFEEEVYPHFE